MCIMNMKCHLLRLTHFFIYFYKDAELATQAMRYEHVLNGIPVNRRALFTHAHT